MTDTDELTTTFRTERWNVIALIVGMFVTLAGVMHFVNPDFFDDIVPPWLPPNERFWTYASGVAELIIGPLVIWRRTRTRAAIAAIVLFIAVYPANVYMTWDWRDRELSDRLVSYVRLPLQFILIWITWRIHQTARERDTARMSSAN